MLVCRRTPKPELVCVGKGGRTLELYFNKALKDKGEMEGVQVLKTQKSTAF